MHTSLVAHRLNFGQVKAEPDHLTQGGVSSAEIKVENLTRTARGSQFLAVYRKRDRSRIANDNS